MNKKIKNIALLCSMIISSFGMAETIEKNINLHTGPGVDSIGFDYVSSLSGDGSSVNTYTGAVMHAGSTPDDYTSNYLRISYVTDEFPGFYTASYMASTYQYEWLLGMSDAYNEHDSEYLPDALYFYIEGDLTINGKKERKPYQQGSIFAAGPSESGDMWWVGSDSASYDGLDAEGMDYTKISILSNDNGGASGGTLNDWLQIFTEDGDEYCLHRYSYDANQYQIQRCGDTHVFYIDRADDVDKVEFSEESDLKIPSSYNGSIPYYQHLTKNGQLGDGSLEIMMNATSYNDVNLLNELKSSFESANINWLTSTNQAPDSLAMYLGGNLSINGSPLKNMVYFAQKYTNDPDHQDLWGIGVYDTQLRNNQLAVNTIDGQQYCVTFSTSNHFLIGRCHDNQSGDSGTAIHDNTLKLYPGSGVVDIKYSFKGFEVTDGQPYQNTLTKNDWDDGYLELDYQAGRSDSKIISNDYRGHVGDYSSYTHDSKDHPDSLNFYLLGNLEINGSLIISDVYFAQDGSEEWWFGSKGASRTGDYLKVTTLDGNYYCVHKGNDSDSSFMISAQCPNSGTQPHMDEFDFDMGEGVYSVSFDMNFGDDEITSGQPHADALSTNKMIDSNTLQLKFNAGQRESSGVANNFMSLGKNAINTLSDDNSKTSPGDGGIYYYYSGKLMINGSLVNGSTLLGKSHEAYTYFNKQTGHKINSDIDVNWLSNENGYHDGSKKLNLITQDHRCYSIVAYEIDDYATTPNLEGNGGNLKFKIEGCYIDQD